MRSDRSRLAAMVSLLCCAGIGAGCRRLPASNVDRNRPPETYLTLAPAESLVAYYRAHVYWMGRDPDGDIRGYEIAVTDSNEVPDTEPGSRYRYRFTERTDSLFVFRADPPSEQQLRGYRIFVRSVDNEKKVDPTPAVAYFVARNDHYPEIIFHGGTLTWPDSRGLSATGAWTSHDPDVPTDTAGVGACYRVSWGGIDRDAGGSVSAFEYKLGSELRYRGGTLADTSIIGCFPPGVSRKQILQVRGVDDAGLRSERDFIRSVILNFDPQTRIVTPGTGTPGAPPNLDSVFEIRGRRLPGGTTLADGIRDSIFVYFVGFDDPRDGSPPSGTTAILSYDSRVRYRANEDESMGGLAFAEIPETRTGSVPYPGINRTRFDQLGSGDHRIEIRARDYLLAPDLTPATVDVRVNYRPYFVGFTARAASSAPESAVDLLHAAPEEIPEVRLQRGEALVVTALALDSHSVDPAPGSIEARHDPNTVVENEQREIAPEGVATQSGYRVFVDGMPVPPAFEPPNARPEQVTSFHFDGPGVWTLVAEVRDHTTSNAQLMGRVGTVRRRVRISIP